MKVLKTLRNSNVKGNHQKSNINGTNTKIISHDLKSERNCENEDINY
jgi:hypothetical protein